MCWRTYNRLVDKLVEADGLADERLTLVAARWMGRVMTRRSLSESRFWRTYAG